MKSNFALIVALSSLVGSHAVAANAKPNIVFLLADDLGRGDLHCYGHPYARTPNIDSLARDGTRFMQYHATGCTCCPARTGLMTSKFPATYPTYPANGGFASHVTISELLKKQGYATGHFGKWHIGPEQKPGTYGIDSIGAAEEEGGKPGHVPAGRTDAASVISGVDWLPTLCAITGVKINANDFDGEDVSAAWLGKATHVRAKPLFWKTSATGSTAAIRDAQWKLFNPVRKNGGDLELYDLVDHPAESKNLAAQHADIVQKLSAKVGAWVSALPKEYLKTGDKLD